jgi:hypothetical protein
MIIKRLEVKSVEQNETSLFMSSKITTQIMAFARIISSIELFTLGMLMNVNSGLTV